MDERNAAGGLLSNSSVFSRVESSRPGPEIYVPALVPCFEGFGAVPLTGAAVHAFFAVELRSSPPLGIGEGLAGADLDAELRVASRAQLRVESNHVIGVTGWGLNFSPQEEGVLLGDKQPSV